MKLKEASARIKINKLIEESGWRFEDDTSGTTYLTLVTIAKLVKVIRVSADKLLK
jgi:type I restriction enzyme R subunit